IILWRLTVLLGYVSDRHVLLLTMCFSYWTVAGLLELPGRVLTWWTSAAPGPASARRGVWHWRNVSAWSVLLLLGFTASGLPKALQPMHRTRVCHRAAGLWLADHALPADHVLDPYCWAAYYGGRLFLEGKPVTAPPGFTPTTYVVYEPRQ